MTQTLSKTTVESKAVLARMLATENLSVEHNPKAETAYFDIENRKLVFPCWEGMTDHLYDMLAGHETAHALFTPAGEAALFEAIKAVDPRPEAASAVKGYLNIVEDARIERLVKEKYPGLRRTFFLAYQDLVKSDIMAPAVHQIATLRLIDRANMHYKVGTFVNVPFTDEELRLVKRMATTKTFEDVVALARDLWQYEKDEKKKQEEEQKQQESQQGSSASSPEGEEGEESDASGSDSQQQENGEENKGKGKSKKTEGEEKPSEENSGGGNSTPNNGQETEGGEGDNSPNSGGEPMPEESKTDGMLNEYSKSKRNEKANYFVTADLPKFNTAKGIIPASTVVPMLVECGEKNNGLKFFTEWKERNAESVAVLCREFERRRAAEAASRTSMSDSGTIDVNRLWSYRVSDEIFRQYANVKNGQSHGIQVFVDFSGSMSGIMYETLSQMVSLAAFCRRMNIPFDVYAFTDGLPTQWLTDVDGETLRTMGSEVYNKEMSPWIQTEKTMRMSHTHFRLVHLLTSGLSERNFRMAVGGMLAIVSRAVADSDWGSGKANRSAAQLFRLNGTPTNQATLAAMTIIPEFRKKNNLQIVHAVFLTDGESGDRFSGPTKYENIYGRSTVDVYGYELRDSVTGNTEKALNSYCATSQNRALNHLLAKRIPGCNVIGISLCPTREFRTKMSDGLAKRKNRYGFDAEMEAAKVKGFCEAEDCYGYTKWFGMNAPHLDSNDYFMGITDDAPKAVLTKAFAKTIKQGTMNRLLLSRFVDLIANHGAKKN